MKTDQSQVELRHLRTLAALRDSGSLVEAAECVHLTQSALSHQMKGVGDSHRMRIVRAQDTTCALY